MTLEKLRNYGNLPTAEKLSNDTLQIHLDSAIRTIAREVSSGVTTDADYIEAVLCQAMIYCLPASNAMYSEGISDYAETGIGRRWLTPAEVAGRINAYEKRKAELIAVLVPAGKPTEFYYEEL